MGWRKITQPDIRGSRTFAFVIPYTNLITYGLMVEGLEGAVDRLVGGSIDSDRPGSAFIPLFEALNWAVALEDRTRAHWAPDGYPIGFKWRDRAPGAEFAGGVRVVRNRVHHQWADAMALIEGDWRWRPLHELPERDKPDKLDARAVEVYVQQMVGKPVRVTLDVLVEVYRWVLLRLEPERWTRPPGLLADDEARERDIQT